MSLHLFVIDKAGVCSPLGAFVDRHEARPVFAKSGAVAGIYTLDNGVLLSTLAEPSEGQLRRLKEFALATLAGTAPAVPPPPEPGPALRRAKPLRSVATRVADLDDENERLRRAPSRIERVASARRIGLAEAAHVVAAEEGEPDALAVGIGATTEPPLPVAFDAPVVAEDQSAKLAALRAAHDDLRIHAERQWDDLDGARQCIERLRVQLADTTARAASLRERSEQLDVARAEITTRDRTIAKLLAAKAHPVVRVAAKPRRARATETPVGTLFRRLAERARGIR